MASKIIDIPNIGPVTMTKRRGNSNIRLSFGRGGTLRVSLPNYVPYQAGVQFVLSKQAWIAKHQPEQRQPLKHQDRIGKAHRLAFVSSPASTVASPRVSVKQNVITVSCPVELESDHQLVQSAAERGALKALKREADQLLPQRLRQLAGVHGFKYKSVDTKRLSSRWGSCSQFRDITLNVYLMQLPWQLIDYVLVHELVHTEHLNHSDAFWHRFEQALPSAKSLRKQLKAHRTMIVPNA